MGLTPVGRFDWKGVVEEKMDYHPPYGGDLFLAVGEQLSVHVTILELVSGNVGLYASTRCFCIVMSVGWV